MLKGKITGNAMTTTWIDPLNINSTTTGIDQWSNPELIKTEVYSDRVELIYKQYSSVQYLTYPARTPDPRIYKVVYSCVDGKWNQSEPIEGKVVPASEESYEFDV